MVKISQHVQMASKISHLTCQSLGLVTVTRKNICINSVE